jgi:major membrane immunogen (membrane-anchored lipoprotein)
MKIVTTVLAGVLLLAGCSGSSDDDPAPKPTKPADTSQSFDREKLERQAKEQAAQKAAADDEVEKAVGDEIEKARGKVVEITIEDGKVTPRGERVEVKKGKKITLLVTSDADEEIHVHSDPEHTYQVKAGGSIEKSFTIDTPGQVAVEAHHLDATIVQLVVR